MSSETSSTARTSLPDPPRAVPPNGDSAGGKIFVRLRISSSGIAFTAQCDYLTDSPENEAESLLTGRIRQQVSGQCIAKFRIGQQQPKLVAEILPKFRV